MSEAKVESPYFSEYFSETERKAQVCGLLERLREKLKKLRVEEQSIVAEIGKLENEEAKREQEAKSEEAAKFADFKAGKITGTLWIDPWTREEATFLYMSATGDSSFAVKAWGDPNPVWIKSDFRVVDEDLRYFMLQLKVF